MRTQAALLFLTLMLAACGAAETATDRAFASDGRVVAMSGGAGGADNACFACHGLDGAGDGAGVPRLAGMDAGYLQKQLRDYSAGLRPDKVMAPIAAKLDDRAQRAVATYYSGLPAPSHPASSGVAPALYFQGDEARGIAACAACHGALGEGVGAGGPALTGQPAAYVEDQLQRWARAERRNDPRGVMTATARGLTKAERRAVSAWLGRQDASRPPDTAAASVRAAADASIGSAPWRGIRRLDR